MTAADLADNSVVDAYEIIGASSNDSQNVLREKFHQKLRLYHPDQKSCVVANRSDVILN